MTEEAGQQVVEHLKKEMEVLHPLHSEWSSQAKQKVQREHLPIRIKREPFKAGQTNNIFENREKKESVNLFGKDKNSVNLFQVQNNSNSNVPLLGAKCIFNVLAQPAIANSDKNES